MPGIGVLLQSKSWSTVDASSRFLLVDEELPPVVFVGDEPPVEDDPPVAFDPAGVLAFAGFCAPALEPEVSIRPALLLPDD